MSYNITTTYVITVQKKLKQRTAYSTAYDSLHLLQACKGKPSADAVHQNPQTTWKASVDGRCVSKPQTHKNIYRLKVDTGETLTLTTPPTRIN